MYIQDTQSVEENGLCEIKIVDNQIMNFNNRSDFLPGLLSALNGIEYYINDFTSIGILYYDIGDFYNIQIGNNTYNCLLLNDEIDVKDGIQENIYTVKLEQSETDYTKADKTDQRINQTYLIVDKQNQKIESVISNVKEQNSKISQINQTVDEISSQISDIADITTYGESSFAQVELSDVNSSEPILLKVHPTVDSISYIYPKNTLYPSNEQYMTPRAIRFIRTYVEDEQTLTQNIDYELPDDLLYYDSETYDEFYLDYESQTCQVTKRCGYNADGTVYALDNEVINLYEYPIVELPEGNYTIKLLNHDYGYLYVRLMAKNIYTTQFYTKAETNSIISQTSNNINLSVNQKLTNYSTTNEMNSAINIKANEITSTVSNKYETKSDSSLKYTQLKQSDTEILTTVSNTYETKNNAQSKYSQLQQSDTQILSTVANKYETKNNAQENYSQLKQSDTEILTTVSSTYETKNNAQSKYSQLQQSDNQISSTVATKVGNNEVISKINQSSESVTINANKIGLSANNVLNILSGNTINLTSKNIAIASNNFSVDKNGNMSCTNANVSGTITSSNAIITGGKVNVSGQGSATDLVRVSELNDSSVFSYLQPSGAGFVYGSMDNAIYVMAGSTSLIEVNDDNGSTTITGGYVRTPQVIQTSLEKEKKNFELLNNAIDILKQIDIYKYNLKKEKDTDKKHIGFVIGDNFNYRKEVTSKNNDGADIYSFVSLCCKAIQEQQEQIEELKKQINKLKEE